MRDVRSDRQRREEARDARRLDRAYLRESEADWAERRARERAEEEQTRRRQREEEREELAREESRRQAAREELRRMRERLTSERHEREAEATLGKSLRASRQQLAEEAQTVEASDWSHVLTLRTQEKDRRLLRLARLHAALPGPPSEEGVDEAEPGVREAKRLRRREAALRERVQEEEGDQAELRGWYQRRQWERTERTRRAVKDISPPPPPVLSDA